ncbi:MAG: M23 family metallopeptidase [Chloroflexota bacterium]
MFGGLAAAWNDASLITRACGHVVLFLLLVVVLRQQLPTDLPVPSLRPPAQALAVSADPALGFVEAGADARDLQRSVEPVTRRSLRQLAAPPSVEPAKATRTSVVSYQVQSGDSLLSIAQAFGLASNSLLWANPKLADNPDFLSIGQELAILPINGAYHTVVNGETLDKIAKDYKVEPRAIADYPGNKLDAAAPLVAGQQLIIPGGVKPYVARRVIAYSGEAPKGAKVGTGRLVWPMSGSISQRYWEHHRAIDIAAATGTPIGAADSGYVAVAQYSDVGYGRMIVIDHGNGTQTLYAHMSVYYVEVGQSVAKGELIGKCGRTGSTTGPHLHFEVIQRGVRRNPFLSLP